MEYGIFGIILSVYNEGFYIDYIKELGMKSVYPIGYTNNLPLIY